MALAPALAPVHALMLTLALALVSTLALKKWFLLVLKRILQSIFDFNKMAEGCPHLFS